MTKSTKYLGIIFDDTLSWSHHLNNLKLKLSRSLGALYKIRNYCNSSLLRQLYFSIVYPHLLYGILSWGCSSDNKLKALQIAQNKILRCLTFSSPDSHSNPLYTRLNILKVKDIFYLQCSLLMHNLHHSILPNTFSNYFTNISSVHEHHTRYRLNYFTPHYNTNYGLCSPSSFCRHIWNIYTPDLKSLEFVNYKRTVGALLRLDYDS